MVSGVRPGTWLGLGGAIHSKLGVNNRRAALVEARARGLA